MQNEWKYIQMVYQKGSFSRAAQALFLTQPALSLAIQRVENEIGMPLFDRTRKPLVLTEAGRIRIEKMNTGSIRAGASISRIPCGTAVNIIEAGACGLKETLRDRQACIFVCGSRRFAGL